MPIIDLVSPSREFPKRSNIVVIGGGVAGTATALELAERGLEVTVVEKGEIAAEQSSRNWGWCRRMGRDHREAPLIDVAMALWNDMDRRVEASTGFTVCGILYLCETEAELAAKADWHENIGKPAGFSTRMISAAEAAELQPGCVKPWKGGLYTPDDGRAEPFIAVPAMALAAQRGGAKIFTHCAARGLETTAGRVSAVVTERGAIACDTAVLAGGAWSRRFCHNAGIALPQLSVLNSVMRTEPLDTGHTRTCAGGGFTFRKQADGGFTVTHQHLSVADVMPDSFRLLLDFLPALRQDWRGLRLRFGKRFFDEARLKRRWALDERSPFEEVRILDPEPARDILDQAAASLVAHFPAFQTMRIAERWGGIIDAMPDTVPVISPVEKLPGFYLCTGFSGHGFGLGPAGGKLMAELVTGEPPCVDPAPFRYSRYFDGSKPRPTTGV